MKRGENKKRVKIARASSVVIGLAACSAAWAQDSGSIGVNVQLPDFSQFNNVSVDIDPSLSEKGDGMAAPLGGFNPPPGGPSGGPTTIPAPLSVLAGSAILGARLLGRRR
jgi:hypothetical protein